jgi:anti-anti-sigma factor
MSADASRVALQLAGEMDLANADLLTAVVANQLGNGRRFVRLDLCELRFVDCAGLRAIIDAHNDCLAAHGMLVLTGVPPRIAKLLSITGLDEALLIADTHPRTPATAPRPPGRRPAPATRMNPQPRTRAASAEPPTPSSERAV